MRAAAVGVSLAAALLLAPACAVQGEGQETGGVHLELTLHGADGQPLERCTRGHAAAFVLVVHNRGEEPRRLQFASAKTHDLVVTDGDGETVWRLSDGRFYAQMLTQLEIPPGGSHELRAEWPVPGDVKPGRYRAQATVPAQGEPLASDTLAFKVE